MTKGFLAGLFLAAVAAFGSPGAAFQQPNTEALYQEARRLFDALDYERAVVALEQAINALEAAPASPSRTDRLASVYEMRARSRFGLGDQDGAKADFVSLLELSPGHALSGQVSPRVVALFEETARETVTNLTVSLTPATAQLQLDGVPLQGPGTIRVAIGDHVIAAEQAGYRSAKETITAAAGVPSEVTLSLERVSSVIRITTTPAEVEVKVNGSLVGKTAAASAESAPGAPAGASAPLVISDVTTGTHTVELSRECFVTITQRVEVERPDDYSVGPVTLRPAVATLSVTANQPGAQVFVDGRERGVAPLKVPDLCEGEHLVEWRTGLGSDSRRISVRAGTDLTAEGVLKPAFALVSSSGAGPSQQDMRVVVERALSGLQTVSLTAPAAAAAEAALKSHQLSADWLAVDAAGRGIGANAQIAGPARKDVSARLAETFRTQGVASVTMIDATNAVVALLGAGSTTPDVIQVALDNQASIAAAVARLDRSISLSRTSLALQVIDVADVAGPVVIGVDASGGAGAGARPGDVVTQADGKPVADAAALAAIVEGRRAGESIALDVRDAAGAPRRVDVTVQPAPRLIGLSEHGLLANRILLDLRARLTDATDPYEQSVIRLNAAVALARLGDWSASRDELQRVKLPEAPTVGNGTVQYLLGLAAENLGNRAEAEAAFKAAAASESLLTEDGPAVKELAEAKLIEFQKAPR